MISPNELLILAGSYARIADELDAIASRKTLGASRNRGMAEAFRTIVVDLTKLAKSAPGGGK